MTHKYEFLKITFTNFSKRQISDPPCITTGLNPLNCLDYDHDSVGPYTTLINTANVFDCKSSCLLDPTCVVFSYSTTTAFTCCLKDSTTGRSPSSGLVKLLLLLSPLISAILHFAISKTKIKIKIKNISILCV